MLLNIKLKEYSTDQLTNCEWSIIGRFKIKIEGNHSTKREETERHVWMINWYKFNRMMKLNLTYSIMMLETTWDDLKYIFTFNLLNNVIK